LQFVLLDLLDITPHNNRKHQQHRKHQHFMKVHPNMTTTDFSKRPEVTVETMVSVGFNMLPDKNCRGEGRNVSIRLRLPQSIAEYYLVV
jgi:hypothetical protein